MIYSGVLCSGRRLGCRPERSWRRRDLALISLSRRSALHDRTAFGCKELRVTAHGPSATTPILVKNVSLWSKVGFGDFFTYTRCSPFSNATVQIRRHFWFLIRPRCNHFNISCNFHLFSMENQETMTCSVSFNCVRRVPIKLKKIFRLQCFCGSVVWPLCVDPKYQHLCGCYACQY